jgi:protein DGCR14
MGSIIQRDFFPDLERLKAQNEYLDAVEKNDILKLRELHAKYSSGVRPPTERCK